MRVLCRRRFKVESIHTRQMDFREIVIISDHIEHDVYIVGACRAARKTGVMLRVQLCRDNPGKADNYRDRALPESA